MRKLHYKINFLLLALVVAASACKSQSQNKYPNTKQGVAQMAKALGKAPMSDIKKLAPTMEDCKAIMKNEEDAQKLYEYSEKGYKELDKMSESPIRGKEGQIEVLVDQLTVGGKNVSEESQEFPGGYTKAIDKMNKGIVMYQFSFVEPGETRGRRFDGLVYVNNKWVLVPKFWRAFRN